MSTSVPFWGDDPLAWDQLKIGKQIVPGVSKVTLKRAPRLDIRKPPKAHYAVLVDQGKPPAEGTIIITLGFNASAGQPFDSASVQWDRWLALEQTIFGKKAGKREAYQVTHPEFARAGISHVYLGDPGELEGEGPGTRKITIPWYEFGKVLPASAGQVTAPAPKANTKPITSLGKAKATPPSATETKSP